MKKVLSMVVLSMLFGCSMFSRGIEKRGYRPKKVIKVPKTRISRRTDCVLDFINNSVEPIVANKICSDIYQR